jgi:ankyrin repeat protein
MWIIVFKFMCEGAEDSVTPLTRAAFKGHADAARVLISQNADVNKPEPCGGITALHNAAIGGHVPVMQLLISKGARIDVRSKHGQTPLYQTAFYGQQEAAICLLDHEAGVNAGQASRGTDSLARCILQGFL